MAPAALHGHASVGYNEEAIPYSSYLILFSYLLPTKIVKKIATNFLHVGTLSRLAQLVAALGVEHMHALYTWPLRFLLHAFSAAFSCMYHVHSFVRIISVSCKLMRDCACLYMYNVVNC